MDFMVRFMERLVHSRYNFTTTLCTVYKWSGSVPVVRAGAVGARRRLVDPKLIQVVSIYVHNGSGGPVPITTVFLQLIHHGGKGVPGGGGGNLPYKYRIKGVGGGFAVPEGGGDPVPFAQAS